MKNIFKLAIVLSAALLIGQQSFAQGCVEASSDEGVKIFGYIQPQWEYWQTTDGKDGNSFTFDRARLGVTGTIPYDVSYYFAVDFSILF